MQEVDQLAFDEAGPPSCASTMRMYVYEFIRSSMMSFRRGATVPLELSAPFPAINLASTARSLAPGMLLSLVAIITTLGVGRAAWPASASSTVPVAVAAPVYDGLADNCFNVYLDFGSNVGIQVRKLFEPELYPMSPVLVFFDSLFGPAEARRENACGF